jgi:hypothetical protein
MIASAAPACPTAWRLRSRVDAPEGGDDGEDVDRPGTPHEATSSVNAPKDALKIYTNRRRPPQEQQLVQLTCVVWR